MAIRSRLVRIVDACLLLCLFDEGDFFSYYWVLPLILLCPISARSRVAAPHFGLPSPPGAYVGNPGYHQPVPYSFQPGFPYQIYGYVDRNAHHSQAH